MILVAILAQEATGHFTADHVGVFSTMRLFVFILLVGLVVAGFNAGLQQIAPAGWWGGGIPVVQNPRD